MSHDIGIGQCSNNQGCIWRGVRGLAPSPARGSWPPESSAEPLWGSTNPPDSIFLLNQYINIQLYAAYQFGNLHARYCRSVTHSQSKLWPPQWKSDKYSPGRRARISYEGKQPPVDDILLWESDRITAKSHSQIQPPSPGGHQLKHGDARCLMGRAQTTTPRCHRGVIFGARRSFGGGSIVP